MGETLPRRSLIRRVPGGAFAAPSAPGVLGAPPDAAPIVEEEPPRRRRRRRPNIPPDGGGRVRRPRRIPGFEDLDTF